MITNPWFYAAAVPAVLLVGVSKGGFAGGLGLMAVPIMALAISPVQAAGIMLPILVAMDAIGVWAYRRTFDIANLKSLVPGAVVGISFGALTFGFVGEAAVRLIVGTIAIAFSAVSLWPGRSQSVAQPARRGAASGVFWGTVAGFTSFIAHAGGPPFSVHMLPQRLDKTRLVGTSVMFFALVNLIKLPPYALLGQLAPQNLTTSLALLPLAPVGIGAGIWLHRLVPERPFYIACYVMILIIGIKLGWDGLAGLM
jgi:uncharacterized protein